MAVEILKVIHIWIFISELTEESPPEPAPPEVPPRGPSLHAVTLRNRAEYSLPLTETLTKNHESQYITQDGTYKFNITHGLCF